MTQYPEAVLPKELDIPYAAVALITDYDTGVEGDRGDRAGDDGSGARGDADATSTPSADLLVAAIPRIP